MVHRYAWRIALLAALAAALVATLVTSGCGKDAATSQAAPPAAQAIAATDAPPPAPPAASTAGFDGQKAYQYVADQVAFGPHSAGTDAIRRVQEYIVGKLQSFGCPVDQEEFHSQTPIGDVAMKNIVVKIPGASPDIVLFTTHYDTKRLDSFVGANDGGSSTAIMLEFARLVCPRKNAVTVWIAFFDGEEAFNFDWKDPDNTYGSRELAARMALSGDLPKVKAFILADMVGSRSLHFRREANSTPWLVDLLWSTAARLGYQSIFLPEVSSVEDDHLSFVRRNVPSADIIDFDLDSDVPFWHKTSDTLDKISPKSLAIVGHVLMESLPALEQHIHPTG